MYHIKGDNNIGKSNLLKAIHTLVDNVSSRKVSKYLRDNEDTFYIEGEDFDGNVVRLSRGAEDYYSWKIDGVEGRVDKTAGKVPERVSTYFNFYRSADPSEVTKGKSKGKTEIVNIRPPRAKLLFVDTTDGDNYLLFQKAMGTGDYLNALKLGNSQKSEGRKEVTNLTDRLEDEYVSLGNVKDYGNFLEEVKLYESASAEYAEQIRLVEEYVSLAKDIEVREARLLDASFGYDGDVVGAMVSELRELSSLLRDWESVLELERVQSERLEILEAYEVSREVSEELREVLATREELENVSRMTGDIERLEERMTRVSGVLETYDRETLLRDVGLIRDGLEITSLGHELRAEVGRVGDSKRAYEAAEQERERYLAEIGICPVCGKETAECAD